MTDLSAVLPDFDTQPYLRLIPSLERNNVTVADLLTLDGVEAAKRAQLPIPDLKRLSKAILTTLQRDLGILKTDDGEGEGSEFGTLRVSGTELIKSWSTISMLDDELDGALGGGVPTGSITEITGERYE
jgi:DNA repair protein RAD57